MSVLILSAVFGTGALVALVDEIQSRVSLRREHKENTP